MKGNKKSFLSCLAFIAFIVLAVLIALSGLSSLNIEIFGSTVLKVLETVKNVCILVVLGYLSFVFVKTSGKFLKIVFFVAVCVFVAGTIMAWL